MSNCVKIHTSTLISVLRKLAIKRLDFTVQLGLGLTDKQLYRVRLHNSLMRLRRELHSVFNTPGDNCSATCVCRIIKEAVELDLGNLRNLISGFQMICEHGHDVRTCALCDDQQSVELDNTSEVHGEAPCERCPCPPWFSPVV